jgi:DNA-binding HxlR family transcriptional regulator
MPSAPAFELIVHHRWSLPVLAELSEEGGAKFATLAHRLDVNRESLRATLDALIELGLVRPNPGHGHPMRPEYLLTAAGGRLAHACARLVAALRELDVEDVALRKWSLPVARGLVAGDERFGQLEARLSGVTARALSMALRSLEDAGLVERRVLDGRPPTPVYRLTPRARPLAPILRAI